MKKFLKIEMYNNNDICKIKDLNFIKGFFFCNIKSYVCSFKQGKVLLHIFLEMYYD